jgi:hypothetical protein
MGGHVQGGPYGPSATPCISVGCECEVVEEIE